VGLAVCATPIGNLDDVTLRVLNTLRDADLVLCEDTRRTRTLLSRHGIEGARLLSYHEHNEARRVAEVLPRLQRGELIALVSDAGLPGISDPGTRLVDAALAAGVEVNVLPGASAVETALVSSGLGDGTSYRFVGYLPRRAGEREALWAGLESSPAAVVAFESPQRLPSSLASLARVQPDRVVAVCRELTKRFGEVVCGPAAEVAKRFVEPPKGEIVIVLAPSSGSNRGDIEPAVAAVRELVERGVSRREAAAIVAPLAGVPRNELYRRSL
jgi:16S rRNA (cytidine1402-2'-O)-methyltransferase